MRFVPSLLIALALIFGVSAATTLTASAERPDEAKAEAKKEANEAKDKTEAEAHKAEQKAMSHLLDATGYMVHRNFPINREASAVRRY